LSNKKHSGRSLQQTRTCGRQNFRAQRCNRKLKKKKKTEELLVKQLKSCEMNKQEFSDSNKRPNLRIMGTEEREEMQAKVYMIYSIK
jgi:hypothetical protein